MNRGRFYHLSSSESESDEEEVVAKIPEKRALESSDSDDNERRIVRSGKAKRYEELENIVKNLKNHKKNRDINNVFLDFESLIKCFEKAKKIIDIEGVPKFYIRTISELEDYVTDIWDNHKKTLNKNNGKSLTSLRQRLRKYNKDFEADIKDFRENPEAYPEDIIQELKNEPEEEPQIEAIDDGKAEIKTDSKDESENESDEWDDTSSASSIEDEEEKELYKNNPAARFLKRADEKSTEKKKKEKKERFSKEKKKKRVSADDDDAEGWTAVDGTGRPEKTVHVFDKNEEINNESVLKKIDDICHGRIVKRGLRQVQLEMLEQLHKIVVDKEMGPGFKIKLLISCTSLLLQYNNKTNPCMKIEAWSTVFSHVSTIIDTLSSTIDILTLNNNVQDESESIPEAPYRLHGCVINFLEHMDDEYTKILQNVPEYNRGTEYIEKLLYETKIVDLCSKLNSYLEKKDYNSEDICKAYLRKVEHLYYRFDHLFNKDVMKDHKQSESYLEMRRLCRYIISKDQTDRPRTRAILCHIYFLALHDHWYESRDMMAMSNLQNSIDRSDPSTQILYNRAMVQLGLCAFRKGFIKDAHQALADLQGSGRVKELLAQGITPNRFDRSKEEENREKARLLPYHQHINLELVECVYLVSAMLTDTAHCLAHYPDGRRRMISRNFHHVLKSSERQTLVGPPETMRDHVVAASKALFIGDWTNCVKNIVNIKMNGKVWDLFHNCTSVKEMITEKIKVESLRTFLLGHSSIYDSLSLSFLDKLFSLDITIIQQTISKMILQDELMASLDEPTNCLIMHRTEPSRLQAMSLRLAERVNQLGELNERLMEIKGTIPMPTRGGQQNPVSLTQRHPNFRAIR